MQTADSQPAKEIFTNDPIAWLKPITPGIRIRKGFLWFNRMSEASTAETHSGAAETQSGTSPARQMLAALTQASKEMTTKFSDVSERASKLNATLENDVNRGLEEVNRLAESIIRSQMAGLTADKDSVLAELTTLRQQELKVLQSIAKNLRDALTEKLNELLSGLSAEVKEQLSMFNRIIEQKEAEVIQAELGQRLSLREKLPTQLQLLLRKFADEKKELESLKFRQHGQLAQESSALLEKLREHGTELKRRLSKEQSEYLDQVDLAMKQVLDAQAEKLEQRLQEFSAMQEKVRPQIQVEMDFLDKLPAAFSASCQHAADLQVNIHENKIKNLAVVYHAEITSITRETEDHLTVMRARLQTILRNYQDNYTERSANLLSKFEQDAQAARPAASETEKDPEDQEVPPDLFDKLRKEIRKTTKEVITATESEMEQSFAEFRTRLNSGSQAACTLVEGSFHECRKKITETAESHRDEIEEISHKGHALEQLMEEAKELIGALNPSNLEF